MTELKTKVKKDALASLFGDENSVNTNKKSNVVEIHNTNPSQDGLTMLNIEELSPFYNHTFKIYEDEKLQSLSDSIKENGVISPILVRPKDNGKFEIVAGHNRVEGCKLAGITEIPAIIKDLTNEESTVIMVDSNLEQREEILFSEKAFSYKAKLEAIKSQGKRNDLTSSQVGTKLRTDEQIASENSDSRNQIQRYIRLTKLNDILLNQVDIGRIKFIPAYNLSFLRPKEQQYLIEILEREEDFSVSNAQSTKLKEISKIKELSFDDIDKVITDKISNKVSDFKIPYKRVQNYFPKTVTPKEINNTIDKALAFYFKHHELEDEQLSENEEGFDMEL